MSLGLVERELTEVGVSMTIHRDQSDVDYHTSQHNGICISNYSLQSIDQVLFSLLFLQCHKFSFE